MFSYKTRQLTSKIILVLYLYEDISLGAEFAVQKLINHGCLKHWQGEHRILNVSPAEERLANLMSIPNDKARLKHRALAPGCPDISNFWRIPRVNDNTKHIVMSCSGASGTPTLVRFSKPDLIRYAKL